jgi:hypothetical protein
MHDDRRIRLIHKQHAVRSCIFSNSPFIHLATAMASAATPPPAAASDGAAQEVFLPPTHVLRTDHVVDALKGVPADARNVTVGIHNSTLGIEKK